MDSLESDVHGEQIRWSHDHSSINYNLKMHNSNKCSHTPNWEYLFFGGWTQRNSIFPSAEEKKTYHSNKCPPTFTVIIYVTGSSKLYLFIVLLHTSRKNGVSVRIAASSFLVGRKSSDLQRQQRSEFGITGQGLLTRLVAEIIGVWLWLVVVNKRQSSGSMS